MPPTRVLLATHSLAAQKAIASTLAGVSDIQIVATTSNLMDTYNAAEELVPDVAIVDYGLTSLEEFEMVAALFSVLDIRWLSMGSENIGFGHKASFGQNSGLFALQIDDSPTQILTMIKSLVWISKDRLRLASMASGERNNFGKKLVLIGSSTGGVDALTTLLATYPADCPPTIIVQHTGSSFGTGLVSLLDRRCAAKVYAAKDGMTIGQGQVCVMAGTPTHLEVMPGHPVKLKHVAGPPISGHLPSIDALFGSAVPMAKNVVAALLTGMGRDGAEEMLRLRNAGAKTIAQDAETSVVYGMPRVAWEIGAADVQLPVGEISAEIIRMCQTKPSIARAS